MSDVIEGVLTWQTVVILGALMVMYGLVPGVMLRLSLLMYPAGHPRRVELTAELYTVPRPERPMWVLEQLETAVAEGALPRVVKTLRQPFRRLSVLCAVGAVLLLILWSHVRYHTSYLPAPVLLPVVAVFLATWLWAYLSVMPKRAWLVLFLALAGMAVLFVVGRPQWLSFVFYDKSHPAQSDAAMWVLTLLLSGVSVLSWRSSVFLHRRLIRTRQAELRRRLRRKQLSGLLSGV